MAEKLTIVLEQTQENQNIFVFHQEKLLEYYQTSPQSDSLVGHVYLGTVERVLPDIKAAFVKFGRKRNGFLPLNESPSFHEAQGNVPLQTGQEIIVQVKKDEKGSKGAFLTRDITFAGEYLLLMPLNHFVGMSMRIPQEERALSKQMGKVIAKRGCGVVIRHACLQASLEKAQSEADDMLDRWAQIQSRAVCLKAPALLAREESPIDILWRDYHARYDLEVIASSPKPENAPDELLWTEVSDIALESYLQGKQLQNQLTCALDRFVALPKGGSLVIDEREALQTIDVNSGSIVQSDEEGDIALLQNLNAVDEIARQIRLRNLSGIILVDFIDMKKEEDRQKVIEAIGNAIGSDRVKQVIHGFTQLGLLEMTRKRTRDSLRELLTIPCNHCHQSGYLPLETHRKG